MIIMNQCVCTFKINGLKEVLVSEDTPEFETPNDDLIEKVQIEQSDGVINGMQFILKKGQAINKNILYKRAKNFLVNIYCNEKMVPLVSGFDLKLKSIYDPNFDHHGIVDISESASFPEALEVTRPYPIGDFKKMFALQSPRTNADEWYHLIFHTMKIDNIVTRYLMQYELLLKLVAHNNKQSEVVKYIRKKYNPAQSFGKIGFQHIGKRKKIDSITYFRNMLAHNNDETLDVQDSNIRRMALVLPLVLFFALNTLK